MALVPAESVSQTTPHPGTGILLLFAGWGSAARPLLPGPRLPSLAGHPQPAPVEELSFPQPPKMQMKILEDPTPAATTCPTSARDGKVVWAQAAPGLPCGPKRTHPALSLSLPKL